MAASQAVFDADLTKIGDAIEAIPGAIVEIDGAQHVDPSKVPAALLSTYSRLIQYGAANGLI